MRLLRDLQPLAQTCFHTPPHTLAHIIPHPTMSTSMGFGCNSLTHASQCVCGQGAFVVWPSRDGVLAQGTPACHSLFQTPRPPPDDVVGRKTHIQHPVTCISTSYRNGTLAGSGRPSKCHHISQNSQPCWHGRSRAPLTLNAETASPPLAAKGPEKYYG